jgi:hypothetical protein
LCEGLTTTFSLSLSLSLPPPSAPQPNLGLGLLHKIRLNFLEASQQFSFYRVGFVAPRPTPTLEDQASFTVKKQILIKYYIGSRKMDAILWNRIGNGKLI